MLHELAILLYVPLVYMLKGKIDNLSVEKRNWLTNKLEIPWVLWCGGLTIFSGLGAYYTGKWVINNYLLDNIYPISGSDTKFWYDAFMLSKIPELLDTFFIVARSKPLVSLQLHHHLVTAAICYFALPISCDIFTVLFFMNYTVHFFMYFYFAMYPFFKSVMRIYGKFVNMIQTSQMFFAMIFVIYQYLNFKHENCLSVPSQAYINLLALIGFVMYSYYAYLFVHLWFERNMRLSKLK